MARKNSKTTPQLNYGIYRDGCQVFDGTEPARYETIEQAQAALPRLQAQENVIAPVWGFRPSTLEVGGRTW